ncbi:MAG: DinB family protein [Planctomycetes bacterium]|nr:DinB family protein [Planctomycetota bacterium]
MSASRTGAIKELQASLKATLHHFDRPAAVQKRSYAPGKWTMREMLVHISDTEAVLLDRLRRLAADRKPVLQGFDQDEWARGLRYAKRDLKLARLQFEAARRGILELLRLVPAKTFARAGRHSEYGRLTFAWVLDKVVKHNAHHLEQLDAIAAGKIWTPK